MITPKEPHKPCLCSKVSSNPTALNLLCVCVCVRVRIYCNLHPINVSPCFQLLHNVYPVYLRVNQSVNHSRSSVTEVHTGHLSAPNLSARIEGEFNLKTKQTSFSNIYMFSLFFYYFCRYNQSFYPKAFSFECLFECFADL